MGPPETYPRRYCARHPSRPRRGGLRLTCESEEPFDRGAAGRTAQEFFDGLWAEKDPWDLETSELDQRRYARQLALLSDRRYSRALELGCAAGSFTRHLAGVSDHVLAVVISAAAVARAREALAGTPAVELRVANVMELDPEAEGPWDLVVLAETAYYLGWLYPSAGSLTACTARPPPAAACSS